MLWKGARNDIRNKEGCLPVDLLANPQPGVEHTCYYMLASIDTPPALGERFYVAPDSAMATEVAKAKTMLGLQRFGQVRQRAAELCMALFMFGLDANVLVHIIEHSFVYGHLIPFHLKWAVATTVKHWHQKHRK